jgi:hypothetical protein
LSIYGIQDAIGKVSWTGKFGALAMALGGVAKALFPNVGSTIDVLITAVITLGGALGLFGARSAITRTP